MRRLRDIGCLAIILVLGPSIFAHSGGTDSQCCHTNRKTGEYHCHGGESTPVRKPASNSYSGPVQSYSPKELLGAMQTPPPQAPGDGFEVVRPSQAQLIELTQVLLKACQYEVEDRKGEFGYSTVLAIRKFQKDHDLKVEGRVTPKLLLDLAKAMPGCRP